jgi:hypothetical protein
VKLKVKPQVAAIEKHVQHGDKTMLFILEKYQELHPDVTVNLDDVVQWALSDLNFQIEPITPAQLLKRKLTRAMKAEKVVDPQDREVRKWHPVRKTEGSRSWTEWAVLFDADPGHMRVSQAQNRGNIFNNCRQHKLIRESYNDNNKFGAKLPPVNYNFELDFAESELPTKYPLEKPEN